LPEPTRVGPTTIVSPDEARSAEQLVDLARVDLQAGAFEAAATRAERVVAAEPGGPRVPEALHVAALAREGLRQHERAAATFSELYAAHPKSRWARDAAVRASRLWVYIERYPAADDAATVALERFSSELSPAERVAVFSARSLAASALGDTARAEFFVGKARGVADGAALDGGGLVSRDLAQMYFALAETRRIRSEQTEFAPAPEDFAVRFEQRAQQLLEAQSAYADALRAEDAHWSARSGTRIGEMYERLHRDVMATPLPEAARSKRLEPLFEGAMRLRYVVLLEKAVGILDRTVNMVERTNERSRWAERARELRSRLGERLLEENRALDALPYSRESLRQVLAELQRRKDPTPGPEPPTDPRNPTPRKNRADSDSH
jgi:tetratricopeptide (TPR) repeat protein